MAIRLQKYLADAGVCSRRHAEELISAGRVKVNSRIITTLGTKVGEHDKIECDDMIIKITAAKVYIMLNKPIGYITSTTGRQGRSILDLVKIPERVYPVGRLDKETRGLVILTNDGKLTNEITHPKYGSEKAYEVVLNRPFILTDARRLEAGLTIDGKKLQPVKVTGIKNTKVNLVLREGINRQIRKMMGELSYGVVDLKRIRSGKLHLGKLKEGQWKKITKDQIKWTYL